MRKRTAFDLFSGCGGLTTGLKQAGFSVLGAVEVDAVAVETYAQNHKRVRQWHCDIRLLDPIEILEQLPLKRGELDLLAGCPPCQGFSSLRTLNGGRPVHDSRNDLIFDFLRFVKGFRPKTVMLENVPSLVNDQRFARFCEALEDLGYAVGFQIIDAADYGVPQRRRRLVLLASIRGSVEFAPKRKRRTTVKQAIGRLLPPGSTGDPLHDYPSIRHSPRIIELIKLIPHDGGSRLEIGPERQLPCHQRCDGFKDVYGRMAWHDVSPTITGGCWNPSKGRFLHPDQDRAITLREAALLQTFPRRYKFSTRRGKSHTAELIGNALPPRLIWHHAVSIQQHLDASEAPGAAIH